MVADSSVEVRSALSFITAGNSEFTIKDLKSGMFFRYKVSVCKKKPELFFVRVWEGDESCYAGYLTFKDNMTKVKYAKGNKGTLDNDHNAIRGLLGALRCGNNPLPRPMIMTHHGRCAHCGKKLKDAMSVARGFGPDCWGSVSEEAKKIIMEGIESKAFENESTAAWMTPVDEGSVVESEPVVENEVVEPEPVVSEEVKSEHTIEEFSSMEIPFY